MFRCDPKHAFDRVQISNRNLDVRLCIKPGAGIDRRAFGENASHSIDGRERLRLQNAMQAANDSAVEISAKSVRIISGQFDANSRTCRQAVISDLYPLNARRRCQVEAKPEFDDRADNEWLVDVAALPRSRFPRKIETPPRIRFPEINTGTKPIIIVVARTKRLSQKYSLADLTVAPVIAKNECRSEPVQELSVVFGEAPRSRVDAF
jgi:hypothetical protein